MKVAVIACCWDKGQSCDGCEPVVDSKGWANSDGIYWEWVICIHADRKAEDPVLNGTFSCILGSNLTAIERIHDLVR